MKEQSEQLRIQRQELEYTRKEYERTNAEMEEHTDKFQKQINAMELQRKESNFYTLVKLFKYKQDDLGKEFSKNFLTKLNNARLVDGWEGKREILRISYLVDNLSIWDWKSVDQSELFYALYFDLVRERGLKSETPFSETAIYQGIKYNDYYDFKSKVLRDKTLMENVRDSILILIELRISELYEDSQDILEWIFQFDYIVRYVQKSFHELGHDKKDCDYIKYLFCFLSFNKIEVLSIYYLAFFRGDRGLFELLNDYSKVTEFSKNSIFNYLYLNK